MAAIAHSNEHVNLNSDDDEVRLPCIDQKAKYIFIFFACSFFFFLLFYFVANAYIHICQAFQTSYTNAEIYFVRPNNTDHYIIFNWKGKYKFALTKTTNQTSERAEYHYFSSDKALRITDNEECSLTNHELHVTIVKLLRSLTKAAMTSGYNDTTISYRFSNYTVTDFFCNNEPDVLLIRKQFNQTMIFIDFTVLTFDNDEQYFFQPKRVQSCETFFNTTL